METHELQSRIAAVQERIAAAARRAGRDPAEVTLVAVSKTHSPEEVAAAYAAGLRVFGENRVEEAAPKAGDGRPAGGAGRTAGLAPDRPPSEPQGRGRAAVGQHGALGG